ncbi:hypothetical protein [Shinella sp.]|uniref:hypothetical protein n=1 Tax=Shinella sp. TaxID=1870904 RepID=UPI003F71D8FC
MAARHCLLAAWAIVVMLASPAARAEGDDAAPPVVSSYDAVGALVRDSQEIQSHYKVCPADIAKTARPLWKGVWASADWSEERCGRDLDACHRDCLEWRNENACFALGRVFEDAKPAVSPHLAQMLFAEACALGSRGGCTNRASGIRNGQYDGDPMGEATPEALSSCYFRTFSISCGDGDAWGCTMLGQSYQIGEGVGRDAGAARRHYLQSCEINPDFAACDFAKSLMQDLDSKER